MNSFKADSILSSHPIDIYKALSTVFNTDSTATEDQWLTWEPETILKSLEGEVSDAAADKVLAIKAVASNSTAVITSAAAFEKTVNAFCNNICIMDELQPPYVEEMSYAVSQIEKIIEEVHGKNEIVYRDEVPNYVASVAKFRGWFMLPKNLSFGQNILNDLNNLTEDSPLYKENKHIVDAVSDFVKETTRKDAREMLEDKHITDLETDDTAALVTKRILGSLLYDPTIIYK